MHGFVVTSLAFVFAKCNAKNITADKGKSVVQNREALLSISADKSCCATTVASGKGMQENNNIYTVLGMCVVLIIKE